MFHSRNRRASVPPPPSSSSLDSDELDELDDPEDDPSSAAWLRRSRLTPRAGDAEVSSACPLIPEGHVHPPSLSGCAHTSSRHARHHARLVSSPGASSYSGSAASAASSNTLSVSTARRGDDILSKQDSPNNRRFFSKLPYYPHMAQYLPRVPKPLVCVEQTTLLRCAAA